MIFVPQLRVAVRSALAPAFSRRQVVALCREVERWMWGVAEWTDFSPCLLCASSYAKYQAFREGDAARFSRGTPGAEPIAALCPECIAILTTFLAERESSPRADAALADVSRALRARGADKDEEYAADLETRASAAPVEPVAATGRCSICKGNEGPFVQTPRAILCERCIGDARTMWKEQITQFAAMKRASLRRDRWDTIAGTKPDDYGAVHIGEDARQLAVALDVLADRPVEVFSWQLARWAAPFQDVPLTDAERTASFAAIAAVIQQRFGRDVTLREE